MGITNLSTFFERMIPRTEKEFFFQTRYKEKVILVVDGPNMLFSMARTGDECLIADVLKLEEDLVDIFRMFAERKIELHIFFDGISGDEKSDTLDERNAERFNKIRTAVAGVDCGYYPTAPSRRKDNPYPPIDAFPVELKSVFISAVLRYAKEASIGFPDCTDQDLLHAMGLSTPATSGAVFHKIFHSHGECDSEVANYALKIDGCIGIMSNDSDHLLFPLENVIKPSIIQRSPKGRPSLGGVIARNPCKVWSSIPVNLEHLPFIAVMCESDYLNIHELLVSKSPPIIALLDRKEYFLRFEGTEKKFRPLDLAVTFLSERFGKTREEIFQELFPPGAIDPEIVAKAKYVLDMYGSDFTVKHDANCQEIRAPSDNIWQHYWSMYSTMLMRNSTLELMLNKAMYHDLTLCDPEHIPLEDLEKLIFLVISGWLGHLETIPDIKLVGYTADEPRRIQFIKDFNKKEIPYYSPILDSKERNYEANVSLLLQMTTAPSLVFVKEIPSKFLVNALALRWIVYHSPKAEISVFEFELLVLASLCVNYGIAGRIRSSYPPISRRSIQVCSFFSMVISQITQLCTMYGVPCGYEFLSVASTFEANLFYTIFSKKFQKEWSAITSNRPQENAAFNLEDFSQRCINPDNSTETIAAMVKRLSATILDGELTNSLPPHNSELYIIEATYNGPTESSRYVPTSQLTKEHILRYGFNSSRQEFPANTKGFTIDPKVFQEITSWQTSSHGGKGQRRYGWGLESSESSNMHANLPRTSVFKAQGGFQPSGSQGGFQPSGSRSQNSYQPSGSQGGFQPSGSQNSYQPPGSRSQSSYQPSGSQGGFQPSGSQNSYQPPGSRSQGGFQSSGSRPQGGFRQSGSGSKKGE
eukprot:TRINITY_DN265_c0_g1_i6.p1 TRINITY_DN265_c0_g1~~TRINITY_DN265_c0_g1_i6.p1  ORF type:complete len:869 (-),score=166.29 TRINITY_DN265_c0_g1_i6:200-2806(-)